MARFLIGGMRLMSAGRGVGLQVPVKRSYGFEREDVARVQQWVLKLRVPATSPPLPSDITGRTFTCLFGTNTSPMEALLLKRKVSERRRGWAPRGREEREWAHTGGGNALAFKQPT